MDKRLQIHVLENVRDNGGWRWGWEPGHNIIHNRGALERFQQSRFSREDYFACVVMMSESGKVVTYGHPDDDIGYWPRCLTVEGLQYLRDIKHPVPEWLKRNWFPVVVALITTVVSVSATVVNAIAQFGG